MAIYQGGLVEGKIEKTRLTNQRNNSELTEKGYRICTVWECALKGKTRRSLEDVTDQIQNWLYSGSDQMLEISGIE